MLNKNKEPKSVAIATLGCRLNQFESDSLLSSFKNQGYRVVSFKEKADVYIVNTCTVTNKSDAKSRHFMRKLKKTNPNSFLLVTGCYAQTDADTIKQINEVDLVVGNDEKHLIYNKVEAHFNLEKPNTPVGATPSSRFMYHLDEHNFHTRTYLKIQDGCNENCSYCKIPQARGCAESHNYADVLANAQKLLELGYKEIILTGINLGDYQSEGKSLSNLLESLLSLKPQWDFRIHLSSIEPNKVTGSIIQLFQHPKLCVHAHLPLQSGSNRILEKMGRRYRREDYAGLVEVFRAKFPRINITTDLMVGFPSETDSDFADSFSLIETLKITHIHTFKYSQRGGTDASKIKEQVPEDIKTQRSLEIRKLSETANFKYRKLFLKEKVRILLEKPYIIIFIVVIQTIISVFNALGKT